MGNRTKSHRVGRSPSGLSVCAALALVAGCSPDRLHGERLPHPLSTAGVSVTEVRTDSTSAPFALRAAPGGLLFVFFGYAQCPDVCPMTLSEWAHALRTLGPEARRIGTAFVTVDPARDSASVLAPFVTGFVPGAHALRPSSQDELLRAEHAVNASSAIERHGDGTVAVSHTAASYLVDAGGHVLVEWDYGVKAADMAHDVRVLLRSQAAGGGSR